jgi:hypothetical protein
LVEDLLGERGECDPDLETADDVGEGGSADERAAIRLVSRKAGSLGRVTDPRVRRQRVYALLARNGFDAEVCREVSARFARDAASVDGENEA